MSFLMTRAYVVFMLIACIALAVDAAFFASDFVRGLIFGIVAWGCLAHSFLTLLVGLRAPSLATVPISESIAATLFGWAALILSLVGGSHLSSLTNEESMRRGDVVLSDAENFFNETGRCPNDLRELYLNDAEKPHPVRIGSEFTLRSDRRGKCEVIFPLGASITCERSVGEKEWYCDS